MNKEELKRILEQHKIWLESDGEEGERANLEGVNLKGANLEGVNLKGANLYRGNLYRGNLYFTNLGGADMEGAILEDAILEGAALKGAFLKGTKFTVEIRKCSYFGYATVNKEQLPWLALNPRFAEFMPTLQIK